MLLGPGDPERSTRAIGVVSVRGTRAASRSHISSTDRPRCSRVSERG